MMPSGEAKACQRKACAITSLLLVVGLLMFVVIFVTLSWQNIVGEDPVHDLDDCRSKATVVTDEAIMQKGETSKNFSEAWRNAEQEARAPAHVYMEKHHSTAIYAYTKVMPQHVKQRTGRAEATRTKPQRETFESRSLYSSLSEAVQILKHSQMTCLSTAYRTDTLLHPNISNNTMIRFSTFILGSDWWNNTRSTSCFEVYTCFGANITHYSALKQSSQVLIPPYEAFKVTDTQTDTQRCKVVYKLKSNLNCVYDKESNMLHPISALGVEALGLIFGITCLVLVSLLLLLFVMWKVTENQKKKKGVSSASFGQNSTHYSGRIDI
ncbi:GPI-linked NAD(P)(+)--arginine ADP-ribosyltransferase 1-like [Labrus bergylta]|uniref:GPI-linked NAD(P)(+)--arginine ADP-ribosyltransferase 1-like n=1 Tax=Labrus bergylta TaxID=56723 RepID=UPI0033134AD6